MVAKTHPTTAMVKVERENPAFTSEAVDRILRAVEGGLSRPRAAALAGVSASTLGAWEKAGLEGDTRYTELVDRLAEAEVKAEENLLKVIRASAIEDGDWKAAAWVLERRFSKDWGAQVKPVADDLSKLSDDEIERRLLELETK